jgi:hypothetical protein
MAADGFTRNTRKRWLYHAGRVAAINKEDLSRPSFVIVGHGRQQQVEGVDIASNWLC